MHPERTTTISATPSFTIRLIAAIVPTAVRGGLYGALRALQEAFHSRAHTICPRRRGHGASKAPPLRMLLPLLLLIITPILRMRFAAH